MDKLNNTANKCDQIERYRIWHSAVGEYTFFSDKLH